MTKTLAISDVRARLLELPEELEKESAVIAVTRRGRSVLAILPWDVYESLEETLEVLGDEELMAALRKSLAEAGRGKTIPWEKVKRGLKL